MDAQLKEELKEVFEETWTSHGGWLGGDLKEMVVLTAMKEVVAKRKIEATDKQIKEVICECLKELHPATQTFCDFNVKL